MDEATSSLCPPLPTEQETPEGGGEKSENETFTAVIKDFEAANEITRGSPVWSPAFIKSTV